MWKTEELQLLFALFGAPPTVLDAVHTHSLTHHDMDHMTTASLVHMGVSSKRVSAALVAQWKSQYSHQDPYVALEDIERAMVSAGEVPLTHSLTHSYTNTLPIIQSILQSITPHSLTHSLLHEHIHTCILTHSLTHSPGLASSAFQPP
jgi:hypothetical protein